MTGAIEPGHRQWMRRRRRGQAIGALAIALVLAACGGPILPGDQPAMFKLYLHDFGLRFTPGIEPPDAVPWGPGVATDPSIFPPGARLEARFGTLTCAEPAKGCQDAKPGEVVPVWLVRYVEAGCGTFGLIHARTGALINDAGGPC